MGTLKLKLYTSDKWVKIKVHNFSDVKASELWDLIREYSGEFVLKYGLHIYKFHTTGKGSGALVCDAVKYASGHGILSEGSMDYGKQGYVSWRFDKSIVYKIVAILLGVAYANYLL